MNIVALPQPKPVKVGFIGAGGCGTNIVFETTQKVDPEEHSHLRLLVANTDGPLLQEFFNGNHNGESEFLQNWLRKRTGEEKPPLTVLQLGESGKGAGGNPEVARCAAQERIDVVKEFLSGLDIVFLLAGLGKGTGTGCAPLFAETAMGLNIPTLAIVTMPLMFEGTNRLKKAQAVRDQLFGICTTVVIHNESIPDKNLSFADAWGAVNQSCILPMLDVLRVITQRVGRQWNIDANDWAAALAAGKFGFFNKVDGTGEAKDVAQRLLAGNVYQNAGVLKKATQFLLQFQGKGWSLKKAEEIGKAIKDNLDSSVAEIADITPGVMEDAEEQWIGMLAVAGEGPSEELPSHAAVSFMRPAEEKVAPEGATPITEEPKIEELAVPLFIQNNTNGHSVEIRVPRSLADDWKRLNNAMKNSQNGLDLKELSAVRSRISEISGITPLLPAHYRLLV